MLLAPDCIPGAVSITAEDTIPRPTHYILVTMRARGPRKERGTGGWIHTAKLAFFVTLVFFVSWASLVPPAAGIP
jgi:hypothetical protein